jgi:sugar O-acyltransferase (sialic acid O-acetyltransferase NeuD family)
VIASLLGSRSAIFVVPEPTSEVEISERDFFCRVDDAREASIFIGIGDNRARRRVFDQLRALGIRPATCVAQHAFVADDAEIGAGSVVLSGAVIGSRARIGSNTIVNTLSSIDHDCELGDHSQVTAGVTFGGGVKVGTNCFFGIKSAVIPNITIGNNVSIMAGALVVQSLPDNVIAGGSPARVMRTVVGGEPSLAKAEAHRSAKPSMAPQSALPLVMIGAGGHARVLIDALQLGEKAILGIVDPAYAAGSTGPRGLALLGGDEAVDRLRPDGVLLVNGVGTTDKTVLRDDIYRRFRAKGFRFATVIHPSAVISGSAALGEGAQVMAGCVIQSDAVIGANSIINTRAAVDHDCQIGETVHIAPGATLSGSVSVGDNTHIGTGAAIIHGISIGRRCLVAAGAVVYRNLPDDTRHIKGH